MKQILLIVFLALQMVNGFSQENTLEETIKKQIGYNEDDYYSFEVKNIPELPNTAVALAVQYQEKDDEEQYFTADLYLYLIDTKDTSMISMHVEEGMFTSDAIRLDQVKLNMGNYKISANATAFGIKASYSNNSIPNPFSNEELYLFQVQNNYIKIITEAIETAKYRAETDMFCNIEGEEINSVVMIDKKMTNGFYNIKVKSTKTILKSVSPKNENDDCIETHKTLKPVTKVLRFRNGKYSLE